MSRTALIVGGNGQIGWAVADRLLRDGWSVRLGRRSAPSASFPTDPPGVTRVRVDRSEEQNLARALGDGVDVVVDCAAFTATHGAQWLRLQGLVSGLVVVSSASVYQDELGRTLDKAAANGFPSFLALLSEGHPTVPPGPQTYSTNKVALERTLLDHARIPVTVLRPCAIHGLRSHHPREWWFVKRVLDGRRAMPLAYNGTSRFHTTATANLAEVCRVAIEQPGTRILNVGDPTPPTVREIGEAVGLSMGVSLDMIGLPGPPRGSVGATPWSIPRPMLVATAAAEDLGYAPVTDHASSMPALCAELSWRTEGRAWEELFPQLAAYPWPLFDYAAEDEIINACRTDGTEGFAA